MKKSLLFVAIAAMIMFWHATPAQAQDVDELLGYYCYYNSTYVAGYGCDEIYMYITPGTEEYASIDITGEFGFTDTFGQQNIVSFHDAGSAAYGTCHTLSAYIDVYDYTLASDNYGFPAVVAKGTGALAGFYPLGPYGFTIAQSNNGEGRYWNYPLQGTNPIPC
jgi:hypothetical protein